MADQYSQQQPATHVRGSYREHQQSELFAHPQPAVQPVRESAVLGTAVQLNVPGDNTWGTKQHGY